MTKTASILAVMRKEGLDTSPSIADHLGVTRVSVSSRMNRLEQQNLVRRVGFFHPPDSRPAQPIIRWALI